MPFGWSATASAASLRSREAEGWDKCGEGEAKRWEQKDGSMVFGGNISLKFHPDI